MKTEQEIKDRIEWCYKALNDPDNDTEIQQIKLYTQINVLEWVLSLSN